MTARGLNERLHGAIPGPGGVRFGLWAPSADRVELFLEDSGSSVPLARSAAGYHTALVPDVPVGARYHYRLDGAAALPDPASRFQPEGVHGPSQVVDPTTFGWRHQAPLTAAPEPVIYELHVGTFSPEGTFAGAAAKLPYLAGLGVDAIELMPLADFPGRWNWGYDPGAPFAPARAYGEPDDLRRLIDQAHGLGLRMILDVVYNHFGPAGAYLPAIEPRVLTTRHTTPWGQAVNFDGPHSHGVRRFFLENALMWLREYRFDGLRLDATFAMIDESPRHFLGELSAEVASLPGPKRLLIAEDPRNQRNVVLPLADGGVGLDAVWADDFHHCLRVRLTKERRGYYQDFSGSSAELARTVAGNWHYRGYHSIVSGQPRGTPAADLPPARFVYCIENHDQVGNRPDGSRLNHDLSAAAYRAASALLLFLPQLPLLFMGQEWGAGTPFLFFTDHEGELGRQVSAGRQREFREFSAGPDFADPQDEATFSRSRLDWSEPPREPHAATLRLYRDLLKLRRTLNGDVTIVEVREGGLALRRSRRVMLLALEADAALTYPARARTIWSSEVAEYAAQPQPPALTDGVCNFPCAAALIVELPE